MINIADLQGEMRRFKVQRNQLAVESDGMIKFGKRLPIVAQVAVSDRQGAIAF